MKASISLKQLRNDPREYIRLLNSGYEVSITEHRKTIATAKAPKAKQYSNVQEVLDAIRELPMASDPNPEIGTPSLSKGIKTEHLKKKYKL